MLLLLKSFVYEKAGVVVVALKCEKLINTKERMSM